MTTLLRSFQGAGKLYVGSGSITIATLGAAAEADYEITESVAELTDVISVSLANADMETGVAVVGAWCSEAGKFKVRISNTHTGTLTGGTATVYYTIIKTV